MKRNSLSTNLKDYTTCNAAVNYHNNKNQMVKEFLDCNNSHSNSNNNNGEDYMNGFPWPPRSYNCSFCRKEFKSAQALGGHMNVHRRDRARLRQSPPPPTDHGHGQGLPMLNLNLNPTTTTTTNPNLSSTSTLSLLPSSWSSHSSTLKPAVTCTLPLFVSPTTTTTTPSSDASPSELNRSWVVVDGILLKNPLSTKTSETTKSKIGESFGGIGEDHGCKILKKGEILRMDLEIGLPREYDLDLELRLGNYS